MSEEIKFYHHPDYDSELENFERYRDLYEGDHNTLSSPNYLWLHEFEGDVLGNKLRRIREQRTQYVNLTKPFVKRFVSLALKSGVPIDNVADIFGEQIENVDGQGTSFENFILNQVAESYFQYGRAFVFVDSYKEKGEKGAIPVLESWNPISVKDWQVETKEPSRRGKLNFLRYEFLYLPERASALDEPKLENRTTVFSIFEGKYTVTFYKKEKKSGGSWKLIGETQIPEIDELPIVCHKGQSWLKDLIAPALLRHNTQSALDNQLLFQAFQRLFAIGNFQDLSGGDSEDAKYVLNEANLVMLNGEGSLQVVEPSNPIALKDRLDSVTNDMFKIAFQQTRHMPSDSRAAEGFQTLREGKEDFLATLKNSVLDLESIINNIVEKYSLFAGKEYNPEVNRINLDMDFTIEDVDQQVNNMRAHWDEIKQYPEWRNQANKKLALTQNLEDVEKVVDEIEGGVKQPQRTELLRELTRDEEEDPEGLEEESQAA